MRTKIPAHFQRRRHERERKQRLGAAAPIQQSRADLWLVRVGYIAQVGALVATILGFYFTVIPLYQKAVLDELIAQREIDLKKAQSDIVLAKREAYEQRRLNFTEQLARSAADSCGETRVSIGQPAFKEPANVRHERIVNLSLEVSPCLAAAVAQSKGASVLNSLDKDFLQQLLATTGKALDEKRLEAIESIATLPRRAAADRAALKPVGEFMAMAYEMQDHAAQVLNQPIPETKLKERFDYQVRTSQEAVAYAYRMDVFQTTLSTIRDIKWPSSPLP